jgi:hypothetical protein
VTSKRRSQPASRGDSAAGSPHRDEIPSPRDLDTPAECSSPRVMDPLTCELKSTWRGVDCAAHENRCAASDEANARHCEPTLLNAVPPGSHCSKLKAKYLVQRCARVRSDCSVHAPRGPCALRSLYADARGGDADRSFWGSGTCLPCGLAPRDRSPEATRAGAKVVPLCEWLAHVFIRVRSVQVHQCHAGLGASLRVSPVRKPRDGVRRR